MSNRTPTHFVDFESSGFHPESYPIALAICSPETTFNYLVAPAPYWTYWSYDAQDLHGISRDILLAEGVPPRELALVLNQTLAGVPLCSDNPADCFWMEALYEAAGIDALVTVQPLESWIGRAEANKVLALMPPRKAHNALADAKALQAAFALWETGNKR